MTQKGGATSSRRIEDLPQTITNQEYMNNIQENSLYYNPICLHTKLSDLEIAKNLHKRTQETNAENERVRRRMEEITTNPLVVLSEEEYDNLTPQQRQLGLGWVETTEGNQLAGYDTFYRRRTEQDIQSALERTVEWRIQNNQNIRLTPSEYNNLTPQQRQLGLGWVETTEGNQLAGYDTFYRRRTAQDINDEHNRNIRAQMNNILERGSKMFRPSNNILPFLAIGYERNTYVQLTQAQYIDYKRLESQLRN